MFWWTAFGDMRPPLYEARITFLEDCCIPCLIMVAPNDYIYDKSEYPKRKYWAICSQMKEFFDTKNNTLLIILWILLIFADYMFKYGILIIFGDLRFFSAPVHLLWCLNFLMFLF